MKKITRTALWLALVLLAVSSFWSVVAVIWQHNIAGKMLSTTSTIAGLTAALQLEVSGFFEKVFAFYGDEEKYPFGPPAHINREITDVPDSQIAQYVRSHVLYETKTAFWLAIYGLALSIPATWLG